MYIKIRIELGFTIKKRSSHSVLETEPVNKYKCCKLTDPESHFDKFSTRVQGDSVFFFFNG